VIIPAVDLYRARGRGLLANTLYVAMTRARSILTLFSHRTTETFTQDLHEIIEDCLSHLAEAPLVEADTSTRDDISEILNLIGNEHRKWLMNLWNKYEIFQEPLLTQSGEIIAEPIFRFSSAGKSYACFGTELPRRSVLQRLQDTSVTAIVAGEEIEDAR
jgi:hypothetical protein